MSYPSKLQSSRAHVRAADGVTGQVMTVEAYQATLGKPTTRKRKLTATDRQKELAFGDLWRAHVPPLPPFVMQHHVRNTSSRSPWRLDYAWPELAFALEVDGGIWMRGGGAHSHPSNLARQLRKGNDCIRAGIRVWRVTTDDVRSGVAIAEVRDAMRALGLLAAWATMAALNRSESAP